MVTSVGPIQSGGVSCVTIVDVQLVSKRLLPTQLEKEDQGQPANSSYQAKADKLEVGTRCS